MPSVTFSSNSRQFLQNNKEKQIEFLAEVQVKISALNRLFIGKIQREQMNFPRNNGTKHSGPRAFGTRVITGQLKRGWYDQVIMNNQHINARVWSTTPYAPMHENANKDGTPNNGTFQVPAHTRRPPADKRSFDIKTKRALQKPSYTIVVKAHAVHFTKRLHVGEAWQNDYMPAMRVAINKAFEKTIGDVK